MSKKFIYIITWITVAIICAFGISKYFESKKLKNNCTEVRALVSENLSNSIKMEDNNDTDSYTSTSYYLIQSFKVSYTYNQTNYESTISGVKTYLDSSKYAISNSELQLLSRKKGYNKGDSLSIYIEKNNPRNVSISSHLDFSSSPEKYIPIVIFSLFIGCIFTIIVKERMK